MKFTYSPNDRPLEGYTIKRGIGRGGFGEVYQALSDGGKEVALKLVQRNLDVELRGVAQCLNLKHPNLVALYDVRQAENGDNWVVMEYVAGESLDQVIARHPQGMPLDGVLAWLRGIGAGVAHLHQQGIVHRDLKPGNLFVENGTVKVGDYGLSKFISASRRSGQTGSVGTVHYMAPEVVNGRYGKEVDLYALGVILYEMLTGRVPFDGQSPGEILMKHMTAWPDLNPVPLTFRPVVARLLEKEPQRRYPSAEELMSELASCVAGGVMPEVPPPVPQGSRLSSGQSSSDMESPLSAQASGSVPSRAEPVIGRPPGSGVERNRSGAAAQTSPKVAPLWLSLKVGLIVGGAAVAFMAVVANPWVFIAIRVGVGVGAGTFLFVWFFAVIYQLDEAEKARKAAEKARKAAEKARKAAAPAKATSASLLRLGIAAAIGTGFMILTYVLGTPLLRVLGAADENGVVYEAHRSWMALGMGLLAFGISAWSLFFVFGEQNLKNQATAADTPSPSVSATPSSGLATGPWQPQPATSDAHPVSEKQ
jgi:serine/threonine protein kinase